MRLWIVPLFVLLIAGCRPQPSPTIVVDPGLLTLVPSDTIFLVGIRMEKLRGTPLYEKYVAQQKVAWVEEFRKQTGLDPRKDLWEFLVASDGKNTIVMTRGTFSEMGMEPKLNREGAKRFSYKGYQFIGDETTSVVFINTSTAIAGKTPVLKTLLDHRGAGGLGIPGWLNQRVKAIPSTNQVWFTGQVAGYMPELSRRDSGNMANLNNFIGAVQSITGMIDFRAGAKIHVDATCESDKDAKQMHDGLRGMIGLGRLNTPSDRKEMLRVFDAIRVEQNQKLVTVDADLPTDLIDELVKMGNSFRPRAQAR